MSEDETHWGNSLLSNQDATWSSVHLPRPHLFLHCVTPHQLGLVSLHMSVSSTQGITPWSLWLKPLGSPHFLPTELRVLSQCFLISWLDSGSLIHRTQSMRQIFCPFALPWLFSDSSTSIRWHQPWCSFEILLPHLGPPEPLKLGPTS